VKEWKTKPLRVGGSRCQTPQPQNIETQHVTGGAYTTNIINGIIKIELVLTAKYVELNGVIFLPFECVACKLIYYY
jgi:hypothetical protein